MPRDAAAVVLAAGRGRRLGRGNKALLELGGQPVLAWSLRALAACPSVAALVVVMAEEDEAAFRAAFGPLEALGVTATVPGGAERWESSRAGCRAAPAGLPLLLVHDAARPFVETGLAEAVLEAARAEGAALAAEPLADTLKEAFEGAPPRVRRTLPRAGLWRAQTPQAFARELLLAAFEGAAGGTPTDEASLVEALGHAPVLVPAPSTNLKITTPADLALAGALAAARRPGSRQET